MPNGNFESFTNCPTGLKQLKSATHWSPANAGSPEFYHTCGFSAEILPFKGKGMAGLIVLDVLRDGVEYLQVQLKDSLIKGHNYCFKMHLLASSDNEKFIDKIGAHFTKEAIKTPNWEALILNPKVYSKKILGASKKWEALETEFVAKGGEKFMTIGNFFESWHLKEKLNSEGKKTYSYYFLDEILVWEKKGSCLVEPSELYIENMPKRLETNRHVVYFEKDEYTISLTEKNRLQKFLEEIEFFRPKQLKIQGHTDSDASLEYNLELSKRRAERVDQFIKKHVNLSTYVLWEGEGKPLNKNATKAEKARNRRVEIIVNLP